MRIAKNACAACSGARFHHCAQVLLAAAVLTLCFAPASGALTFARITRSTQPIRNISHVAVLDGGVRKAPAGVDFSSVDMAHSRQEVYDECPPGVSCQTIDFLFMADKRPNGATPEARSPIGKELAPAFEVFLAIPPHTFWVNLRPDEPHRILDKRLGATRAGHILLEADLFMKKTVARLTHPGTPTGRNFWETFYNELGDLADNACFSFRQWMVPGTVNVIESSDSFFITEATINVMLESEYLSQRGHGDRGVRGCPDPNPAVDKIADKLFRQMILPKLIYQVNNGKEYEPLRTVFYWRVLAEHHRRQVASGNLQKQGVLGSVDSNDVSHLRHQWSPVNIFRAYVKSVSRGEYNMQVVGGDGFTYTFFYGAIDFREIPHMTVEYV